MDWDVQVLTQDNQIKNIKVYDYNYPSDAERAALAQTQGTRVFYCSPIATKTDYHQAQQDSNYYADDTSSWSNIQNNIDYSTTSGRIQGYLIVISGPSLILFIIHPLLCIGFNIIFALFFARWWFTD